MKIILYISICSLLTTVSGELTAEFDLIMDSFFEVSGADYMEDIGDYTYKIKKPVDIPLSKFSFVDTVLSYPFIIKLVFQLESFRKSSVFSISDESGKIKLGLSFFPASEDIIRVLLESDKFGVLHFTVTPVEENKIMKLLIHVTNTQASASLDCTALDPPINFTEPIEEIKFNDQLTLHLGYSEETGVLKGGIKEIKISTNVQNPIYVHNSSFCTGEISLPEGTAAKESSGTSHAEFLRFASDSASATSAVDISPSEDGIAETLKKCDKGEKGDRGEYVRGPRGYQGDAGAQGAPGERGAKGDIGMCECSEGTISSLLKKMPEMRGPKGETGSIGETGGPGPAGLTGMTGHRGEKGAQGDRGETGEKGQAGQDGALGPKGEPGKDGKAGPQGLQGPEGPPGPPGPVTKEIEGTREVAKPGEKGEQGSIGPTGPPGPIGPNGEKGQKGEAGIKGEKGDQGLKGTEGIQGEKGERGSDGENGIPGTPGSHGRPGERGEKGEVGEKGAPGADGMPAKWTSLLDKTMDADDRDKITELLRGVKGQKGNQGEKGDIGDQGPIGPPGRDGKDGRNGEPGDRGLIGPKGDIGPVGPRGHKGATGEPGPPGNTPAAAISLTKGPKGERGHPGKQGPRGYTGQRGSTGPRGQMGPSGPKGNTGSQGPMGIKGVEGKKGAQGEKGEKGDRPTAVDLAMLKGDKGDIGNTGPMGPIGPPGSPGAANNITPIPGPPGPPGPPGLPGLSITGPKGEPAAISNFLYYGHEKFSEDDDFYEAATVVYRSTRALRKRTPSTPLGTLAFVMQEKMLLLRVENGWQYVVMGSIMETPPDTTTAATHAMHSAPVQTPFISTTIRSSTTAQPRNRRLTSNYLRLVALNNPYTGRLLSPTNYSGFSAVDNDCTRESRRHGIYGSFSAFLRYDQESIEHIVQEQYRHLPVANLFGDQLFDSWSSMFDGSGAALSPKANIYGFNRRSIFIDPIWPEQKVWHGTNSLDVRQKANCYDWRTDSPKHYGTASSLESNRLLSQEMYPCDSKFIVLCIETSPNIQRQQRHTRTRKRRKTVHNKRT